MNKVDNRSGTNEMDMDENWKEKCLQIDYENVCKCTKIYP